MLTPAEAQGHFACLLKEFEEWSATRADLSAQEEHGGPPASDWHDSDDSAVALLESFAENARDAIRRTPEPEDFPWHKIEEHAKVYLLLDQHGRWKIDRLTLDGYSLDGLDHGAFHNVDGCADGCEIPEGDVGSHPELHGGVTGLPMDGLPQIPNGEELFELLGRALGKPGF